MLAKLERLTKGDIALLRSKARSCPSAFFVCKWQPNNGTHSRFAVVVSYAVCKKAVDRNRKRRQTYEAIRLHKDLCKQPMDAMLFAKKSLVSADYNNIEKDIIEIFQKLSR